MIDTSKVIHAPVGGGRYTVTAPIVKEDYGLYLKIEGLELPSTYEVDFSNSEHNGTSVTMIGNIDGVLIPSQFISSGKDIFAFLYHVGDNYGRTVFKFRIPNKLRPDRTDETPTPEEQSVIDQAISALNTAVAQTAQDVIDADASAQASAESARASGESALSASNSALSAGEYASNALSHAESASASATASAQSAEQSAINSADAQDSAEEAQASATASAESASASANSASQASASATSASQSATSAQGYASQAQTSAQTASGKATEASGYANTASQKASDASDSASAALGYKTDAESAKTSAQTAQGKAEDAQTAAETAHGLAEDAQEAAESAAASVSASAAQIATNTADIADLQTDVAQNEADILKAFPTDSASGAIASFPDGADDIPLKSLVVDINPVQDLSNGDPSPENICPISGWTGMELQKTRTNVLNPSANPIWDGRNVYTLNQDGSVTQSGNDGRGWTSNTFTGLFLKKGQYTLSFTAPNITCNLRTSRDDYTENYRATNSVLSFTLTEDCIVKWKTSATSYPVTYAVQLEVGTEATAYEPYNGTTIPINWQTEAGTVYGGKLDVLSGELVDGWGRCDLGALDWKYDSVYQRFLCNTFYALGSYRPANNDTVALMVCDKYATGTDNNTASAAYDNIIGLSGTRVLHIKDTSYNDKDAFKASLSGTYLVFKLLEPTTVQLSATQVNSLLGVNNLWADSGDTEVEYRADTKLYIERLTAPDSADMIADANITSGQYFMVGNSLYKATANIANGSAIVVGTNCIRKSLSEALNEINA